MSKKDGMYYVWVEFAPSQSRLRQSLIPVNHALYPALSVLNANSSDLALLNAKSGSPSLLNVKSAGLECTQQPAVPADTLRVSVSPASL